MRAARSARRSTAIARIAGSASIHSIATEPEPAPMSHSSSPRRGASDDSVTARISRLVIWPSCSNRSSARPGVTRQDARVRRGLDLDRDGIERVDRAEIERRPPSCCGCARAGRRALRGPSDASCRSRFRARSCASAAGPSPSEVRARMRAPGCRCGRTRSSVRPCSESSTVCGNDQPSRAAARLKADGAGTTIISRASMCRASTAPTP